MVSWVGAISVGEDGVSVGETAVAGIAVGGTAVAGSDVACSAGVLQASNRKIIKLKAVNLDLITDSEYQA